MTDADTRGSILSAPELEAIKAREKAATPGPWAIRYRDEDQESWVVFSNGDDSSLMQQQDAEFIAHAREDVPKLLDALAQADAARLDLETALRERTRCRDDLAVTVAAQAERITHLETALTKLRSEHPQACRWWRDEFERCDCERGTDADILEAAALVASRSPAQEKP